MAKPNVLVLRAPGTNCDEETAFAFEQAGANADRVHVNRLIESPDLGSQYQVLCFPGGFSYGDDIAAGRILAQRLKTHLADLVETFKQEQRLVIGICNGFQVLVRLGIFFDATEATDGDLEAPATLTWNRQARFEDRWVHLKSESDHCPFLRGIDRLFLPMAHAEGRFVIRDEAAANTLKARRQLCLRYSRADGTTGSETLPFPENPNGADENVAGICDASGRIFGLMPHPERYLDATQHPSWTREKELPENGQGLQVFQNAVEYFA
jgi:phosphoribosylformylglycinamidine synthase I